MKANTCVICDAYHNTSAYKYDRLDKQSEENR